MHHVEVDASTGEVVYEDGPPVPHDLAYSVCGDCGTPYLNRAEHDHG